MYLYRRNVTIVLKFKLWSVKILNIKKLCISLAAFIIIPIAFMQIFFILKDFSNSINSTSLVLNAVSSTEKDNLLTLIDFIVNQNDLVANDYDTLSFLKSYYKNGVLEKKLVEQHQKNLISEYTPQTIITSSDFSILSCNLPDQQIHTHPSLGELGIDSKLIENCISNTLVSDLILSENEPPFIFIASKVKNTDSDRSTLGYVISKYPVNQLNLRNYTSAFSNSSFSSFFVIDKKENIIFDSADENRIGQNFGHIASDKKIKSKYAKDGYVNDYILYNLQDGTHMIGSFFTIDNYDWTIFCVTDLNSIYFEFFRLFILSTTFTIILFVLLMISGILFFKRIAYPISSLFGVMTSIANGNLTEKWNFQDHKILGNFSHSFNNMIENIKKSLDEKETITTSLSESQIKYNNILTTTQNLIIDMDLAGNKLHIGDKWITLIGTPIPTLFSTNDLIDLFDHSKSDSSNLLVNFLSGLDDFYTSVLYLKSANDTLLPVIVNINVIRSMNQKIKNLTCIISNISNYDPIYSTLNATHDIDSLTSLFSKRNFLQKAEKHFNSDFYQCFISIDIDNMKDINDQYGYDTGDEILKQAAHRLQKYKFADTLIGRDDASDFVLFLYNCKNIDDCILNARVIQNIFKPTFKIHNSEKQISITFSIGICANNSSTSNSIKTMLYNSKIALLESKKNGKDQIKVFSNTMLQGEARKNKIKHIIKTAFNTENLCVYFQPIYNTDDIICEFEASLKLTDSELGQIHPDEFIVVAEEQGLILELSRWYFYECCHLARKFLDKKIQFSHISLNLSLPCMKDNNFLNFILQSLNEFNLEPNILQFDILESSFLIDVNASLQIVNKLTAIGVQVGLSNLSSIYKTLDLIPNHHFNRLKISPIFMQKINHSPYCAPILTSIFSICKQLGLAVIVQGVETQAQYNLLKNLNCQFMQGIYFNKPMPERELYHVISVNHHT